MPIDLRAHRSPPPTPRRPRTTGRRTAAVLALAGALWMVVFALVVAIDDFPRGLLVLLCALLAAAGVWEGVLRRGWGRVAALAVAARAVGVALLLATRASAANCCSSVSGRWSGTSAPGSPSGPTSSCPPADRPQRPVLFVNPRSGDGKAARSAWPRRPRARDQNRGAASG